MSEAWVLDYLGEVRDAARARGLFRLAEHLDDAVLIAASEYHEAQQCGEARLAHDDKGADAVAGDWKSRLH